MGQQKSPPLSYGRLPDEVVQRDSPAI